MLLDLGTKFCHTLLDFSEKDQFKVKQAIKELELIYNKSQSNNLTGPAQSALDDIDKFNL